MKTLTSIMDKILTVRDQGKRPTCLAFAASEAHAISHKRPNWLSPEYLYQRTGARIAGWSFEKGLSLDKVVEAIRDDGQPDEHQCPYQDTDMDQVKAVSLHPDTLKYSSFKTLPSVEDVVQLSASGSVFVLGLDITDQFHYLEAPYIIDDADKESVGGHAMVLAGIHENEDGTKLFQVKNTWGDSWGREGFAWITESFLKKYLIGAVEFKEVVNACN